MPKRVLSLPYPDEVSVLFDVIADEPWAIWLDSGTVDGVARGRYDILSAAPSTTLLTQAGRTLVTRLGVVTEHTGNPLPLLRAELAQRASVALPGLPFAGGAMG